MAMTKTPFRYSTKWWSWKMENGVNPAAVQLAWELKKMLTTNNKAPVADANDDNRDTGADANILIMSWLIILK